MAVRAVAFDLDGTLYLFRHVAFRAAAFALRHARYSRTFSRVRRQIRRVRPIQDFHRLQAALFAAATGLDEVRSRAWIDRWIYGEWVRSFRSVPPYPGLLGALDEIERRGLALAVLSDFPVREKLDYLGLSRRFAVTLCAEESGYLKPNPEPFELLVRRLGIPPAEVLFVGDSHPYDIVGARAAGLRTAHVSRRRPRLSVADVTFSRYGELLRALEAL